LFTQDEATLRKAASGKACCAAAVDAVSSSSSLPFCCSFLPFPRLSHSEDEGGAGEREIDRYIEQLLVAGRERKRERERERERERKKERKRERERERAKRGQG
jgi:hypothetical protein